MSIKKYLPNNIKLALKKVRRKKNELVAYHYWSKIIVKDPQKHANYDMRRQHQNLIRPVDLSNPIYFNEKMLWIKYYMYNDSPLVAQCYNKFYVRKYIESKGLGHILNTLYGVWHNTDEIEWQNLPEEYVMKITNSYGGHVFKRAGQAFDQKAAIKTLNDSINQFNYFYYLSGDLFVGKTEQLIICEKMLESSFGFDSPEDYKFYCFNGEPKYVEIMMDRNSTKEYKYIERFFDIDFHDRHELEGEASPGDAEKPACYDEMINIARILSEDFPFVRVDLYVFKGKPIFGELTFTPYHAQTKDSLVELGNQINLEGIEQYKEVLSKTIQ